MMLGYWIIVQGGRNAGEQLAEARARVNPGARW